MLEEAGPSAKPVEAMEEEDAENEGTVGRVCFTVCEINISFMFRLLLAPQNMYMYEGQDYSKLSQEDKKTFDQLLAG